MQYVQQTNQRPRIEFLVIEGFLSIDRNVVRITRISGWFLDPNLAARPSPAPPSDHLPKEDYRFEVTGVIPGLPATIRSSA